MSDSPSWHHNLADWQRARDWARDLLTREDWLLLDTETTGLGSDAEAIQISVLAPDGSVLLNTLLRPSTPIEPDAAAVHGMTDEQLADAPVLPAIWDKLMALLADKTVVAYNAAFDRRILRQSAKAHGLELPEINWDCAMQVYAAYYGDWSSYHRNYRWQRLPRHNRPAHEATGDCLATLDLIRQMAEGK